MDEEILRLMDSIYELIPVEKKILDDHELICECFCVTVKMIREIGDKDLELEGLKQELNLGNGCRSCLKRYDEWKERIF